MKISDNMKLGKAFASLSKIFDEAILKVSDKELCIQQIDVSAIMFVSRNWDKHHFNTFEVDSPEKLGVNLRDLSNALNAFDEPMIELSDNKLLIYNDKKKFTVSLIDIDEKEIPDSNQILPRLTHTINLNPTTLKNAIKEASMIADSIQFVADGNGFHMIAENEINKYENKLDNGKYTDCKVRLAIDYLNKALDLSKSSIITQTVTMRFGKDLPCQFEFDDSKNWVFIAPRVED